MGLDKSFVLVVLMCCLESLCCADLLLSARDRNEMLKRETLLPGNPSRYAIFKLCKLYRISPNELLGWRSALDEEET